MKNVIIFSLLFAANFLSAQTVFGTWKSVDDTDGKAKSHIEIYEENGKVYGKIVKLLEAAEATHCDECEGDKKGAPLEGMVILYDLEKDGNTYSGGKILDPADGSEYKCFIELEESDKLKVRGYIGFALIGRTQYWYRVK